MSREEGLGNWEKSERSVQMYSYFPLGENSSVPFGGPCWEQDIRRGRKKGFLLRVPGKSLPGPTSSASSSSVLLPAFHPWERSEQGRGQFLPLSL